MREDEQTTMTDHERSSKNLKSYITGFILSILLTLGAYVLVIEHLFTGNIGVAVLILFAVVQLLIQLLFFLHISQEAKPRWKLLTLLFMLLVLLIIVIGSLWIMNNLNYRMTPAQMNKYMNDQSGL